MIRLRLEAGSSGHFSIGAASGGETSFLLPRSMGICEEACCSDCAKAFTSPPKCIGGRGDIIGGEVQEVLLRADEAPVRGARVEDEGGARLL